MKFIFPAYPKKIASFILVFHTNHQVFRLGPKINLQLFWKWDILKETTRSMWEILERGDVSSEGSDFPSQHHKSISYIKLVKESLATSPQFHCEYAIIGLITFYLLSTISIWMSNEKTSASARSILILALSKIFQILKSGTWFFNGVWMYTQSWALWENICFCR